MFKGIEDKDQIHKLDKDLILIYGQQSAEIAIGRLMSPFLDPEYNNNLYSQDQETSSDKEIAKVDAFAGRVKTTISGA